jgi:hypothetical protein
MDLLETLRKAQAEGEARRKAQIAALTPEQVEQQKAVREQQIRTAEKRSAPMRPLNRQPIHLQDEE